MIIQFLVTFSAILQVSLDWSVVNGGGNLSTCQNPLSYPKVTGSFLICPGFEARQWWKTAGSQWQRLKPLGYQGRPSWVKLLLMFFQIEELHSKLDDAEKRALSNLELADEKEMILNRQVR